MNGTEDALRRMMFAAAALVAVGTVGELVLVEHTGSAVQLVPFGLAGLGLVGILAVLARPARGTVRALRAVAVVIALGSAFGMYEHFEHNHEFEVEIRPAASAGDHLRRALFGASPLLAPGMLLVVSLLSVGATYRHPALHPGDAPR